MTNQEIKTVGQTIAQETQIGGNTAARVGGVVEGIGVALDNKDAANGYYQATINGGTITVNAPNYLLGSGGNLRIKMPSAGTTASTLTIGNANAVQLWYNGAAVSAQNTWEADEIISVFYDGTRFMASNSQGGGGKAEKIKYDNSQSGLAAENVQGALDEVSDATIYSEEIDLSSLTAKNGFLASATSWKVPTSKAIRQHVSIPVAEGEWYRITANSSKNAYWNYLKSDQIPTVNNELYNSDYQLQSTSAVGETVEFQIPAGHTWLAIDKSNTSANDFLPASLCKVTKLENVVDRLNSVESELDVLDDCIKLDNIARGLAITKNQAISNTGSIATANGYCYTEPVYIESGTKISVTYCGGCIAVMSLVDGSAYVPKITDNRIDISNGQATQEYTTEVSGYYVFSYLYTKDDIDVPFYAYKNLSFNDALKGEEYNITVMSDYSYIVSDLTITSHSHSNKTHYFVTNPISLRKNQTIMVNTLGGSVWIVAQYENNRITKGLVFSELKAGALYSAYSYTARDDMDVVVCGVDNVFSPLKVYIKSEEQSITDTLVKFNNEMFGIYLYPFRAIVNREVWMYKDSLVSGLNPMQNYNVQCVENRNDYLVDYGKYSMYYKTPTAGVSELTVTATDQYNNTIRKTVNVMSVPMPSVKLENEESIDVLFMGDSLIGFNYNLIGAEFKRMLATSDAETHIDPITHAIQLPTLNICPNKINLVGEQSNPANGARYTYIYRLQQILTGKRTRQYNANIGTTTYADMNPFYNPNSSNQDTVGSDGFNQRVDFEWYFTNACGEGKYPKLFYIAIGANDVYYNNWSADTSDIANNLILLIKKLKSVCDGIAGGDSGIKIKVFNHQFYPLHNMFKYEAPLLQQRIAWQALYDSYYNAINDPSNEVSDYAELIDCGSKFDWRVGYTQEDVATNVRYNGNQDIHIEEACHMNNVGAYNYADCLITDFLADTDFD